MPCIARNNKGVMNIKSKIESILFVAAKPMSVRQIAALIDEKDIKSVESALIELSQEYKNLEKGIMIVHNESRYQMVSAAENSDLVKKLVKDEITGELSRPSLETLTIIAYRGPIAKIELDRIRGVNCALILKNLILRGLIEAKVEAETGEAIYCVTLDFLRFLGVASVEDLPDYERLRKDEVIDRVIEDEKAKEQA